MEVYRLQLITTYFKLGLSNEEILCFLAHDHGIVISSRTLKRLLAKCKLYRRKRQTDIVQVALFVLQQCETSGRQHGYRWMHRKCLEEGYVVDMETVRCLLTAIDPDGVSCRKKHKLLRRRYLATGPNAVWHLDGYDKLKPFGICIHGCIDGFSRYVIWLEAWTTNNDPNVIAGYYTDAVRNLNGCPQRVRSDAGTENSTVSHMQRFLRSEHEDSFSGDKSFLYGSSHTNQRIEAWWSILRKQWAQYWMDHFKHLKDEGSFSGDFIDKNLIQFTFLHQIQNELKGVAQTWNFHHMRFNKMIPGPHGKPVVLYSMPTIYNRRDHLQTVRPEALQSCVEEVSQRDVRFTCDPTVFELCILIMEEHNWQFSREKTELTTLYLNLRQEIRQELFDER